MERIVGEGDKEIRNKGKHIATIIGLGTEEIESIIQATVKKSRQKVDWNYFGERVVVKVIGNENKARSYLKEELDFAEVENYRFIQ